MTESSAFLLDLYATNGAPIGPIDDGNGGKLTLHEWTTWLRIRSDVSGFVAPLINVEDDEMTGFVPPVFEDDGIAVLIHARDHHDLGGTAIGLSHARLDAAELAAVRASVAEVPWPTLPRPVGGDFNAPDFMLRYACGNLLIKRGFNARSGNFIEAIAPLWTLLHKLTTRTKRGASGTLEPLLDIDVRDGDPRRCNIRFGLRNRSIGPVGLNDPRVPSHDGKARLEVQIGERVVDRDWVAPHEWTTLDLPPLPEQAPRSLMLAARKRWELETPWIAPKPGHYEVRMRWLDYDGPVDPLPAQIPFMPVPSKGPSFVGSGPYPIRGCCRAARRFEIRDDSR